MPTFDFAFEGFRIIRERPKLILLWGAVTLFAGVVMRILFVTFGGPGIVAFNSLINAMVAKDYSGLTEVAVLKMMDGGLPGFAAAFPVNLLMTAVITCAVCRVALGNSDDRLGFLAFGLRELQVFVVRVATLLILAAAFLSCYIAGSLIGSVFSSVAPGAENGFAALGMLAGIGLAFWLGVRLSLNAVQTFDTWRIDIFGSFSLTRDRFWSLVTGYAVTVVMTLVVTFLCQQITAPVFILGFGIGDGGLKAPETVNDLLQPVQIVATFVEAGLMLPLLSGLSLGAPAAAYRQIKTGLSKA